VEYDVNRPYGGSVRTRQLQEILARLGNPLLEHNIYALGSINRWRNYARGMAAYIKHQPPVRLKPRNLWLLGSRAIGYGDFFVAHRDAGVCLWETTFDHLGPAIARHRGIPVVALPHNLESLVPAQLNQYSQDSVLKNFSHDLASFSRCDAVFTISREEQWLLNLCGCQADYLPYFPAQARAEWLLEIRRQRISAPQTNYLILGSASYPPTFQGMAELTKALGRFGRIGDQFVFAGYGTERLAGLGVSGNFQFLGSVTDEHLRQLLVAAKTALVYQNANAGALTRIPELILAGVPVLANEAACRSWQDLPGLCSYATFPELESLLGRELPLPPVPAPPQAAEGRLLAAIRKLLKV
jgi:glycosyltransferase involved in cell wall biosynthesis